MTLNHLGITVTDIDAAARWYESVFGLEILQAPMRVETITPGLRDVFGPRLASMRIAHLQCANGIGFEIFQFDEPETETRAEGFEYWRTGLSHLSFTVADVPVARGRVLSHGGTARTEVREVGPGRFICYCQDPWGTTIEISSRPYDELVAGLPGAVEP